jgi:hypothetical protein
MKPAAHLAMAPNYANVYVLAIFHWSQVIYHQVVWLHRHMCMELNHFGLRISDFKMRNMQLKPGTRPKVRFASSFCNSKFAIRNDLPSSSPTASCQLPPARCFIHTIARKSPRIGEKICSHTSHHLYGLPPPPAQQRRNSWQFGDHYGKQSRLLGDFHL